MPAASLPHSSSADNMPATLLFLFAAREDAETAISNGLCPACATLDNLPIRVIDKYRDAMIPVSASSPNRVRLATPDFLSPRLLV